MQRVIVAGVIGAMVPATADLPAIGTLGLLTALMVGLITFEAIRFSEVRELVRHDEEVLVPHPGRGLGAPS